MHFSLLDAFFHVATQGSQEAYRLLYNEFLNRARGKINLAADNSLKFTGFSEDLLQFVDELFLNILSDYDSTKGSFAFFADYVLNLRIPSKVAAMVQKRHKTYQVKNENGEDMDIEDFADPHQNSISYEVAMEDFRLRISSPNRYITNDQRMQNKISMMRYAGYKKIEICKMLKISEGTLRKYLKLIKNSDASDDFKLDLK